MDTKLKNVDEKKKHNRFVSFLLNRKTRAIITSVACILAAITYLLGIKWVDLLDDYYNMYGTGDVLYKDYTQSRQFRMDKLEMYEALCITSSFYLRNTDANGNFNLSNAVFRNYVQTMKNDYGFNIKKDDNGRIYADSDKWDFYVAFGDKYLTNMDYDFSKISMDLLDIENDIQNNYSNYYIRQANSISTDVEASEDDRILTYDGVLDYKYEENYNADFLPLGASGYDNLGRFIFQYYGDTEVVFYEPSLKDDDFSLLSDYEITHNLFVIDYNGNKPAYLITDNGVKVSSYAFNEYSDMDISLFFAPKYNYYTDMVNKFSDFKEQHRVIFPKLISCVLLCISCCVYLAVVCGYDEKSRYKWRQTVLFGRWYTDILLICLALGALVFFAYVCDGEELCKAYFGKTNAIINITNSCIIGVLFAICIGLTLAIVAKFKTQTFVKDSLIYKLTKRFFAFAKTKIINTKLFTFYNQKTIGQKLYTVSWIFIIWTVFTLLLWLLFIFKAYYSTFFEVTVLLLTFVYLVYAIWYVVTLIKGFVDIHNLSGQIEQISKGETVSDNIHPFSPAYIDSQRLQNLSKNIKETVEKQIQSERMKIELVTNVSHDLKTPLTSIISYIDLLKKEELSAEAMDYVKIIDAKSEKLKDIVSDVFSLAKATSGIDVELKEIDGVVLLNQVLADNQDRIKESGKTIITKLACDRAIINADGNKLYRVFQNLIDNALSYSLEGTRVFITLECNQGNMVLQVKNTASYEMKFTPEEIMERFSRGDKSRTDGGNGLGLSIAKTFTEACGGNFLIELDGDVFKAFVEIPLNKRE